MKFVFDDDMTYKEKAEAILRGFGLDNIEINPDFLDVFVDYFDGMCGYDDDDFHYTYEVDMDADSVKWFAELLTGKLMDFRKSSCKFDLRKLNENYLTGIFKVISYGNNCLLVHFEDYEIDEIELIH